MTSQAFTDMIGEYFENIDEKLSSPHHINSFLIKLEEFEISVLESAGKGLHQKLLFILLKVISLSEVTLAVVATERLLLYLKKITNIFESFSPNEGLLKQLN